MWTSFLIAGPFYVWWLLIRDAFNVPMDGGLWYTIKDAIIDAWYGDEEEDDDQ